MAEPHQRYNVEFKKEAVKFTQEGSKTIPQIADELNVPASKLQKWVAQYREFPDEPFVGSGNLREEALNAKIQAERIRDLEEKSEILKMSSSLLQQRPEVKFLFIEEHRSRFRVEKMCKVLNVSWSGFYKWQKSPRNQWEKQRKELAKRI
jgi:transposase-like protein